MPSKQLQLPELAYDCFRTVMCATSNQIQYLYYKAICYFTRVLISIV